ncbi:MAG: right-handed parallel beta-helix repeat-containing protein [Candidatus Bathyarchaeota archaeon]|nr:MAG: right-handed parallel beta-helix repeat-containing protein [Candidatus Bathyarchaeota archaeon]
MRIIILANLLLLSACICTSIIPLSFQSIQWHSKIQDSIPSWLEPSAYMTYEQLFEWADKNQTDYMMWNITDVQNPLVDLYLISHGVNITDGNITLTTGEADLTMNATSRTVINCSDPNYIGEQWPFWIETNVTLGSPIDIWYGSNVISRDEMITILGHKLDCWVVEYNWTTASMQRWYDKTTGIVLRIRVTLYHQNITTITTETAVSTNLPMYCKVQNLKTGLNYTIIQEAIDASETLDGHTIFVKAGFYYENLLVNKSISLIGEARAITIIDGSGETAIIVIGDDVLIANFTIQHGSTTPLDYGIRIEGFNSIVKNCIIRENYYGIWLESTQNCTIFNSIVSNNTGGIYLYSGSGNKVRYNSITNNVMWGMLLSQTYQNNFRLNRVSFNGPTGVSLYLSGSNLFRTNDIFSHTAYGMELGSSSSNTVQSNRVYNCSTGIKIGGLNNTIRGNWVSHTTNCIELYDGRNVVEENQFYDSIAAVSFFNSHQNQIRHNTVYSNKGIGFEFHGSNGNTVRGNDFLNLMIGIRFVGTPSGGNWVYHNNFIGTVQPVSIPGSSIGINYWDNGMEGNYWSIFDGEDVDHDGICDFPWLVTFGLPAELQQVDNYPLMGKISISEFRIGEKFYQVTVISNSTSLHFDILHHSGVIINPPEENESYISIRVWDDEGTLGFCRAMIPTAITNRPFTVYLDGVNVIYSELSWSNETHAYLYFTYLHPTMFHEGEIIVISEFSFISLLLALVIVTSLVILVYKREKPGYIYFHEHSAYIFVVKNH